MAQLILHVAAPLRTALLLCGFVAACSADDGPAVPFKFGEPDQPTAVPTDEPSPPDVAPGDAPVPTTTDGVTMVVSPQGVIALQRAVDGDRNHTRIAELHTLAKGCAADVASMQLNRLSSSHAFATVNVLCAAGPVDPSVAAPAPTTTTLHWLLSTDETPRVLERFGVLPAQPGGAAVTALRLTARAEDVDGDQNVDAIVTLTYAGATPTERAISLRWMNRVGGLDRDRSEPEATFATMLTTARRLRASSLAYSSALNDIVTGHELLCSESGHARIAIGGRTGINCGRSRAVGGVWTAIARERIAHAAEDPVSLLSALDAFDKLADPTLTVDAVERTSAEQALKRVAATAGWQWKPGPSIAEVRAPQTRLPMVAFVDDHTLLLRGATQQNYDLLSDTLTTVNEAPADLLLRDPTGNLALVGIERRCDGYRLKIVRAEQVVGGIVLGSSVAEPLIEARTVPANARCDDTNAAYRGKNDGRWTALGWAPSAILLGSGHAVHAVAVDTMAHAAGAAARATIPLPTPVAAGAIAPDGTARAVLTSVGILVLAGAGRASLIEPLGPVSSADVAVAPNAARLAYVFGGRVFIGTPPTAAPATP